MLTSEQIDAGVTRLESGKLTTEDVDKLVGVMRMFFEDLETKYGYDWRTKLLALDDTTETTRTAAQIGACINEMEALGFGVSSLGSPGLQSSDPANKAGSGSGADGLYYKEKDEYWQYVVIVHTKFYTLPLEFTTYSLGRRNLAGSVTGTAMSQRIERGGFDISERGQRRFSRRRF